MVFWPRPPPQHLRHIFEHFKEVETTSQVQDCHDSVKLVLGGMAQVALVLPKHERRDEKGDEGEGVEEVAELLFEEPQFLLIGLELL